VNCESAVYAEEGLRYLGLSHVGWESQDRTGRVTAIESLLQRMHSLNWKALMNNEQSAILGNVRQEKMHGICCRYRHVQGIIHDSWHRIS